MANTHETLTGLFTDIAGAIRSKTGGTASIVADNFPTAISSIEVKENLDAELSAQDSLIAQISTALVGKAGVALPVLSNPAGAGNIEAGYQAIDGAGKLIEGSAVVGVGIPAYKLINYKAASADLFTVDNTKTYLVLSVVTDRNSGNWTYGAWCFIKNGVITKHETRDGSALTITNNVVRCNVGACCIQFSW